MKLTLNQGIQLEVRDGGEKLTYDCQVTKINSPFITAYIPGEKVREKFPPGSFQQILLPSGNGSKAFGVKIEKNAAIPYIDLRILKKEADGDDDLDLEETSIEEIQDELRNDEYANLRTALRVEDSFPIEFYLQSGQRVKEKKESYKKTSTRERRKSFLLEKGVVPAEVFHKIYAMDNDMFDVFSDIYRRLAVMAGKDLEVDPDEEEEKKEKPEPENIGTCVDISATGLRFLCGTRFKPNDILKVMVSPTAASPSFSIASLMEVVKVARVKDGSPTERYSVVVKFHSINEDDMELLTRYTVLRQMEKSREGKGLC